MLALRHRLRRCFEYSWKRYTDPGFTNTNLCMIHVSVDPSLPENQAGKLKPELEENEFIEVFSVPLRDLWTECQRLEGEGYAIDARVGTLAEGIEVTRRWGLYSGEGKGASGKEEMMKGEDMALKGEAL